ncbi:MAG: hypothetical protein J7K87_02150 [Candidatus Aenigmarchaeota archaeon]|nr:hypothetical protein [Candidatus Aenigmarchaeota archaeon]
MSEDVDEILKSWSKRYGVNFELIRKENSVELVKAVEKYDEKYGLIKKATHIKEFHDDDVLKELRNYERSGKLEEYMENDVLENLSKKYKIYLDVEKRANGKEFILGVLIGYDEYTELDIIKLKDGQTVYDALIEYEAHGKLQGAIYRKLRTDFPHIFEECRREWESMEKYYVEDEERILKD